MACRCQERRAAIRRAVAEKTALSIRKEVDFIMRTATEDLRAATEKLLPVNIRRPKPKG